MIGSKLGDYEILRLIGKGGMGAVYEALKPSINRRVAIKVLLPEYAEREDVVRRFMNEARAVNAINHPGVVQISDVGKSPEGSLYLVMEYLEGETLTERMQSGRGQLPEEESITIAWQLAAVLAAAHGKGIIHRDLKPSNVMLVPDLAGPGGERVKLLDFGIAKLGSANAQGDEVKTRTGQIMGTAAYMSPEQFGGHKPTDGQSDVYSLACLMFRLLTGQQPFISDSGEMAVAAMHMFKQPPPLLSLLPEASPWLVSLIDSMMRKEPTERPTMAQVTMTLQEKLPDYAQSRKSLPPGTLGNSGAIRISSSSGRSSLDALARSSPDSLALTVDQQGSPGSRSFPGTITGATGEASPPPPPRAVGRWSLRFAAALLLLMAVGGGTLLLVRNRSGTPSIATTLTGPGPVAPLSSPTPGNDGGSPKVEPAPKAAPTAGPPSADSEPAPSLGPDHATVAAPAKPGKTGTRKDGRSRSRKSHATQIIN